MKKITCIVLIFSVYLQASNSFSFSKDTIACGTFGILCLTVSCFQLKKLRKIKTGNAYDTVVRYRNEIADYLYTCKNTDYSIEEQKQILENTCLVCWNILSINTQKTVSDQNFIEMIKNENTSYDDFKKSITDNQNNIKKLYDFF